MTPFLLTFVVVVSGVFGLVIGSFLNVVAVRVPAGTSLLRESRCPRCATPIEPWHNIPVAGWLILRGRCASCRAHISARYPVVEGITGVSFALVAWFVGATITAPPLTMVVVLIAFQYLVAISVVLTLIDLDTHRLPNAVVLPSYIVGGALLAVASALDGDWTRVVGAAIGMAVLYTFYLLIRLIRPDGMGGGDVKLAGLIGMYLGWLGWGPLVVGTFAAFLFGGIFGIALIVARRAGRSTAIPFGPWMILGAWTGVFTGDAIGRWYVNFFVGA